MNNIQIIQQQFELRLFDESIPRIEMVLKRLTLEQIWYQPNENSNSIGNLILHLVGNVTQWICSGIGKKTDIRQRDQEFTATGIGHSELISRLHGLRAITVPIIQSLRENELSERREVQGFDETVLSIIIHVIEHFSYHTGQIAYIAKILLDDQLGFYEGLDLNTQSTTV